MADKPQLISFVTCDGVHFDNASGKYYLLGVFSGLRAVHFPVQHPRMYWFLTLTEVPQGTHKLTISMNLPTEAPRTIAKRAFQSRSPLDRIHIVNEFTNIQFDKPGDYSIVIEVNDEPLLVTSFPVAIMATPPAGAAQ